MTAEGREEGHWAAAFFRGRRALVTGGASGIGAAIAAGFAAAAADVTATGLGEDELAAAVTRPGVTLARLDVRDAAAVETLLAAQWSAP